MRVASEMSLSWRGREVELLLLLLPPLLPPPTRAESMSFCLLQYFKKKHAKNKNNFFLNSYPDILASVCVFKFVSIRCFLTLH